MYLVVGQGNCPYCELAKEMLTRQGKDFIYIDLSTSEHGDTFKTLLKDNMNLTKVPQVFKLVGGYDLLEQSFNGG